MEITLDTLFRTGNGAAAGGRDQTVIYDRARREVLPRAPLLGLWRTIDIYAVQTDVWSGDRVVRCVLRLNRGGESRAVGLYIEYSACCPTGRQERAVVALAGDAGDTDTITAAWEHRLIRYVEEHADELVRAGSNPVTGFLERRSDAVQHLLGRAASDTGLAVRLRLQLAGERALEEIGGIEVGTGPFGVRPKSFSNDLMLDIQGHLGIEDGHRSNALLRLLDAKEDAATLKAGIVRDVKDAVQRFVSDETLIEDFDTHRFAHTRSRLCERLNSVLRERHGRAFSRVDVMLSDNSGELEDRIRFEAVTDVKPCDSQKELTILSDVAMQLENPARLQATRRRDPLAADPGSWLKKHLGPIVRDALFDRTYADLILNLENDRIRAPLAAKASEIGYAIKHYSAVPEQSALRLKRDGVRFVIEQGDFATRDTRVRVALDLAVSAEMPSSLDDVRRFIRPDLDLTDEIRRTAWDAVQAVLHTVTPEAFYTQFSSLADDGKGGARGTAEFLTDRNPPVHGVAIEQVIRTKVVSRLEETFRLRSVNVVPKMAETSLTRRYMRLCAGIHELTVPVGSIADGGRSGTTPYFVSFKITGMGANGWTIFQTNSYDPDQTETEIADIKEALRDSLQSSLSLLPPLLLGYRNERERTQVHESALVARQIIEQAFGLSITIVNFRRDLSADEQLEHARQEAARQNLKERFKSALEDARLNRNSDTADLLALRDHITKRLQEGIPPDDEDMEAYLNVIDQRKKSTDDLLAYQAPVRPTDHDALDIDVYGHISSLKDPSSRLAEIDRERRAKLENAGGAKPQDGEPAPE
ncbi:hypothetical protein [Azospirillum palustre]